MPGGGSSTVVGGERVTQLSPTQGGKTKRQKEGFGYGAVTLLSGPHHCEESVACDRLWQPVPYFEGWWQA